MRGCVPSPPFFGGAEQLYKIKVLYNFSAQFQFVFSVEYYLDNLSQLKTSFFLTNVTLVWMSDEYVIPDFSTGGVSTYTLNRYTGDNETFQFFDSLRCFFMRCTHTGAWLARTASDLLSNFAYLLPWNAVVHADGTRVPMNAGSSSGRF